VPPPVRAGRDRDDRGAETREEPRLIKGMLRGVLNTDAERMRKDERRFKGLDVETGLWILVGLAALSMRIAQLDGAPLSGDEAEAAAMAWRAAQGDGLPVSDYNPLLLAANSLTFLLFGAGDGLARSWPVVFGTLLVLTPLLWRRFLGRRAALAAGVYLALSPTALVASRRLDGTVIGAAGAMVALGALVRWFETKDSLWLTVSAIGLAIGLSGGASLYGLVLPLIGVLVALWRFWPDSRLSLLPQAITETAGHRSGFGLVLLGACAALSTGLGWNLAGLGAAGGHLASWVARFGAAGPRAASPLLLLVLYELFGFVWGLGGLIWGLVEGREEPVVLGFWAVGAGLVLGLMPGRAATDLLWVVVPLALLTGMGIDALARGARVARAAVGRRVGLRLAYGSLVVVLSAHGFLMLAQYGYRGDRANLVLAAIAVVVQAPLALSAGLILGAGRTLRTAAAGIGLVLLVFTVGAGWDAAYGHPADPREPLQAEPTALNVRDLVTTLEELSWLETGMRTTLPFVYETEEHSTLAWYLREFDDAERVTRLEDVEREKLSDVLVTEGRESAVLGMTAEPYTGQDFSLSRRWSPRSLGCQFWDADCRAAVEWFLFRTGVPLPEAETWATLWRVVREPSSP